MKRMLKVERIFDPELGEGISSTEYLYHRYYTLPDVDKYYISFTAIEKLGVNPGSKYETPIGIYTYPLEEFFHKYVGIYEADLTSPGLNKIFKKSIGSFAPFAGGHKWVHIVKFTGSRKQILNVEDLDKSEYERSIKTVVQEVVLRFKKKNNISGVVHPDNAYKWTRFVEYYNPTTKEEMKEVLYEFLYDNILEHAKAEARIPTRAGYFWNFSRLCSATPAQWNANLRACGYELIADYEGSGIIHPNEPMQAVFLSIKYAKVVDKIENVARSITLNIDEIADITEKKLDYVIEIIQKERSLNTLFNRMASQFDFISDKYGEMQIPLKGFNDSSRLYDKYYNFYDMALEEFNSNEIEILDFASRIYMEMDSAYLTKYDFVQKSWQGFEKSVLSMYKNK